jgi:hypothetical protein
MFCICVKKPLLPGDNPIAVNKYYLFICSCFWWNTHGIEFSYTAAASVYCVLSQVFVFGSCMGLVFFVLRAQVKAPLIPLVLGPLPMAV